MQEHAQISADGILIDGNHKRGQHVRAAGEDLSAGAIVLEVGHCIGPAELGLIASLGVGEGERQAARASGVFFDWR